MDELGRIITLVFAISSVTRASLIKETWPNTCSMCAFWPGSVIGQLRYIRTCGKMWKVRCLNYNISSCISTQIDSNSVKIDALTNVNLRPFDSFSFNYPNGCASRTNKNGCSLYIETASYFQGDRCLRKIKPGWSAIVVENDRKEVFYKGCRVLVELRRQDDWICSIL